MAAFVIAYLQKNVTILISKCYASNKNFGGFKNTQNKFNNQLYRLTKRQFICPRGNDLFICQKKITQYQLGYEIYLAGIHQVQIRDKLFLDLHFQRIISSLILEIAYKNPISGVFNSLLIQIINVCFYSSWLFFLKFSKDKLFNLYIIAEIVMSLDKVIVLRYIQFIVFIFLFISTIEYSAFLMALTYELSERWCCKIFDFQKSRGLIDPCLTQNPIQQMVLCIRINQTESL